MLSFTPADIPLYSLLYFFDIDYHFIFAAFHAFQLSLFSFFLFFRFR